MHFKLTYRRIPKLKLFPTHFYNPCFATGRRCENSFLGKIVKLSLNLNTLGSFGVIFQLVGLLSLGNLYARLRAYTWTALAHKLVKSLMTRWSNIKVIQGWEF